MGHGQWGMAALSQKFHKSDSLSPAAIRHLQDHFRNALLLGKWWAGCDLCHRVMEKLWTGPAGSAIHTPELDAGAAVGAALLSSEREDRRSWNEEGSSSSQEGMQAACVPGQGQIPEERASSIVS